MSMFKHIPSFVRHITMMDLCKYAGCGVLINVIIILLQTVLAPENHHITSPIHMALVFFAMAGVIALGDYLDHFEAMEKGDSQ